jgi:hypothetical protein
MVFGKKPKNHILRCARALNRSNAQRLANSKER